MSRVDYWKGIAIASTTAGPLFLLTGFVMAPPPSSLGTPDAWPVMLFVAFASVPFGFVLALPVNWLGTALLGALGRGNDAVRLPILWALVGAGVGALIDLIIAATDKGSGFVPAFTLTGLTCSLLCRAGTRWTD